MQVQAMVQTEETTFNLISTVIYPAVVGRKTIATHLQSPKLLAATLLMLKGH